MTTDDTQRTDPAPTSVIQQSAGVSLEIQNRLSQSENYNRWIYEQFRPFIGQRVLDVGCAIGNITQFYMDRDLVVGLDVVEEFIDLIKKRFADYNNFEALLIDIADPAVTELAAKRIDTITCANVLEHVDNDARALAHMREILVPGGVLTMLVPAFTSLFGTMDEADHHYRRYTRPLLQERLLAAGFEVERIHYMNPVGMAGWWFNGKVLRKQVVNVGQYAFYDRLVPALSWIERRVKPPFGLSVIAAARKPT
jgi:SAM-dependent methyltransferase